jgi:shikimate dehydrogenase
MNEPRAGLIGYPVSHSLSPVLHQGWLKDLGLAGRYDAFAVPPEELPAAILRWRDEGVRGGNITIPHKVAALSLVDEVDATALAIGAVNTLVIAKGIVRGFNTDAGGFIAHLSAEHPDWLKRLGQRPVLVLGAGGAARAVVYGLARAGARHVRIANRSPARTAVIVKDLGALARLEPITWEERDRTASEARLIVNTTSLGMKGEPELAFDVARLAADTIAADIVYNPLETAFLKAARARGLATLDGLGFLIHQARPGFKAWFGVDPPANAAVRQRLVDAMAKH